MLCTIEAVISCNNKWNGCYLNMENMQQTTEKK